MDDELVQKNPSFGNRRYVPLSTECQQKSAGESIARSGVLAISPTACEPLNPLSTGSPGTLADVFARMATTEAACKAEVLRGTLAKADRVFAGVDDAIANWSVAEARRAARAHAETLWALRGVPSAS